MVTIGFNNIGLFPETCEKAEGVAISKSSITGKFILAGRAVDSDERVNFQHKAILKLDSCATPKYEVPDQAPPKQHSRQSDPNEENSDVCQDEVIPHKSICSTAMNYVIFNSPPLGLDECNPHILEI